MKFKVRQTWDRAVLGEWDTRKQAEKHARTAAERHGLRPESTEDPIHFGIAVEECAAADSDCNSKG